MRNQLRSLTVAIILAAVAMTGSATTANASGADTCREIREFFGDAVGAYYFERQKHVETLYERGRRMGYQPDRSAVRSAAARHARLASMNWLEQVAAMGWPTTRDRTLRLLLKDISENRRTRSRVLSLGSYCKAKTYIGLRGR